MRRTIVLAWIVLLVVACQAEAVRLHPHEQDVHDFFQAMEAGEAARTVGYLSASQFRREYARFVGHAPMRDVVQIRAESANAAPAAPTR